jgi:hypothetical protein
LNTITVRNLLCLVATLLVLPVTLEAAPQKNGVVKYEADLAMVPAIDPKPTAVPQILPAMKGQHPRLLFTSKEIEILKKQIASDPLLQKTYKDNAGRAKAFTLAKESPPAIVLDDTSALSKSVGQYPSLAYVYALDHDPSVKQAIIDILTMMLEQPHWADTTELDCNMGAGNNMLMVAVLFDAVYNDLEPAFRVKMAEKILVHVRRMYYLGYKELCLDAIKYWQQDPQPNHRWHRGAGMAACLLAIADIKEVDSGYMLEQFKKEMDFLIKWYPTDGDCHEGAAYQEFGFFYLAAAAEMMDRVLGTEYLKHPGFRNAWAQQVYYSAPGRMSSMSFGDAQNQETPFSNLSAAFFLSPHLSRDKNVQAALTHRFTKLAKRKDGRTYENPWMLLAYYDPTVGKGDYQALPTYRLFADLGAATMRDSWEEDAVLFTFKCGPYGGYRLNEYRHEYKDEKGEPHYVNLAHDDPDANSIALGMAGDFLLHPGLYSTGKTTAENNTILVDGKGQLGEGDAYTQPVPGVDMRTLSYLTGWKVGTDGRIIIEGEAGNAYKAKALQRFRRTAVWMPGEYILILDDIRGAGAHDITWKINSEKAQFENPATGRCYVYTKTGQRLDLQILASQDFKGSIDFFNIAGRWGNALLQQLQFFLHTETVKFACLLDPWKRKPELVLKDTGDTATVTVRFGSSEDTWTWQGAKDLNTPSSLTGKRGTTPLIALTEKDKAPREETLGIQGDVRIIK